MGISGYTRILVASPNSLKDADWPVLMCGGNGRCVNGWDPPPSVSMLPALSFIQRTFWLFAQRHNYEAYILIWLDIESILLAVIFKFFRISKPILIVFDLAPIPERKGPFSILREFLTSYAASRLNALIMFSHGIASLCQRRWPAIKHIYSVRGNQYAGFYLSLMESASQDGSIFSGGTAARDWRTLIEAARCLPNERFVTCALSSDRNFPLGSLPPNVTVHFNVSPDRFYKIMGRSKIVVVPLLRKNFTSGLIVAFYAMQAAKPLIITRTLATEEYIQDGENGLLVNCGDIDGLTEQIRRLANDVELQHRLSINARDPKRCPSRTEFFQQVNAVLDEIFKG